MFYHRTHDWLMSLTPEPIVSLHVLSSSQWAHPIPECFSADVNAQDNFKWTPLHFACHAGMKDLVEYLLDQGANLEAASLNGATPFLRAIQSSKPAVVQYLIDRGCKVQVENKKGTDENYCDFYLPLFMAYFLYTINQGVMKFWWIIFKYVCILSRSLEFLIKAIMFLLTKLSD